MTRCHTTGPRCYMLVQGGCDNIHIEQHNYICIKMKSRTNHKVCSIHMCMLHDLRGGLKPTNPSSIPSWAPVLPLDFVSGILILISSTMTWNLCILSPSITEMLYSMSLIIMGIQFVFLLRFYLQLVKYRFTSVFFIAATW